VAVALRLLAWVSVQVATSIGFVHYSSAVTEGGRLEPQVTESGFPSASGEVPERALA